jgi:ketosteroid isomerase-like protein
VSSEQDDNKGLSRRYLEATARADLDSMDEMMAPSSLTAA